MAKIDWERERQRLTELYFGMEDLELEKIGRDPGALTDVARQALAQEMSRRGMHLPASAPARVEIPESVVIHRYRDLPDATLAKSILESAGIESMLVDDNMVRMDWFYSNLVGGIKLFVRVEDAEAAGELLDQKVLEAFDVEGVGEYQQPYCPQCASFDVSFDGLDKRLSYAWLWVGFPIPVVDKDWKCHKCQHAWRDQSAEDPGEAKDEKHSSG